MAETGSGADLDGAMSVDQAVTVHEGVVAKCEVAAGDERPRPDPRQRREPVAARGEDAHPQRDRHKRRGDQARGPGGDLGPPPLDPAPQLALTARRSPWRRPRFPWPWPPSNSPQPSRDRALRESPERLVLEQAVGGGGQCVGVPGFHEQAVSLMDQVLRAASRPGRDDGYADGHRLEGDEAERLVPADREEDRIVLGVDRGEPVARATVCGAPRQRTARGRRRSRGQARPPASTRRPAVSPGRAARCRLPSAQ